MCSTGCEMGKGAREYVYVNLEPGNSYPIKVQTGVTYKNESTLGSELELVCDTYPTSD